MQKPSIAQLVYKALFPKPKPSDPSSFAAHVARNLVPEVRIETQSFYGALDCLEAQYPGLDYAFKPHRRRLSRFPWHKKLFKAFDDLNLTRDEILTLCSWEGTTSAKEKYEREVSREIRDTTLDGIAVADDRGGPVAYFNSRRRHRHGGSAGLESHQTELANVCSSEDSDSFGRASQLEAHLLAAMNTLSSQDLMMSDDLQQWIKEAAERNEISLDGLLDAVRAEQARLVERRRELQNDDMHNLLPPLEIRPPRPDLAEVDFIDPRMLSQMETTLMNMRPTSAQRAMYLAAAVAGFYRQSSTAAR